MPGQIGSERDYNPFPVSITGVVAVEIYPQWSNGNIGL
jgi:hypothetical protein